MPRIRINRFVASTGAISRRFADELVRSGRVAINSRIARIGDEVDTENDEVTIDGLVVKPQESRYLAMNKPKNVLTTMSDPRGRPCIKELVPSRYSGVFPVGRLDFDAEGLLILTNDGDLAHKIHHPSFNIPKTYVVRVKPRANQEQIHSMSSGIVLDGEKTRPAKIEAVRSEGPGTTMKITLVQGLNNQIKRMAQAVGLEVTSIRRISVGPVRLSGLAPGTVRELTRNEILQLHKMLKIHK